MVAYSIILSTGCFYKTAIFEVIEPIRESGFSRLEITASPSHLDYHDRILVRKAAEKIGEAGLEALCYHAPFGLHLDISSPDADFREQSVSEMSLSLAAAATLGARYFVMHPGPDFERLLSPAEISERRSRALESLDRIAGRCREEGLLPVIENMLPYHLFGGIDDLLWFREKVDGGRAGLCLDTGHANLTGELYTVARRLAGHAVVMHAHDNIEADDHLPPGKGRIDWSRLLKILSESGFAGLISLELDGAHGREPAAVLNEAREARELLQGILSAFV